MSLILALVACGGQASSPIPSAGAAPTASSTPIVRWQGGELTLADVQSRVQTKLDAMEQSYQLERYQLLVQALDGAVDDAILEAEAKAQGKADVRELLKSQIEDTIVRPSEEEMRAFYENVKDQVGGAPYEAVESLIAQELVQRQMADRYTAYVRELRGKAKVEGSVPYPDLKKIEIALADTDPVLGSKDAVVNIVQFAEYQCHFCNVVSPTLHALVEDYDGKVNVIFKDFPLENHQRAKPASIAARCAGDQGKYWEMNKLLLGNQRALSDADFTRYATEIGLGVPDFEACLTSGAHVPAIDAAFAQGRAIGVDSTPTLYVNGVLVSGAQPYDVFKTVIDQELARR